MTRPILALILAILTAAPMQAQRKPQEPEAPKLVETIDVRVINIDVVVTDRRGNPVRGLTKDDFEIYENNVRKTISNFYEVQGDRARNIVADETGANIEESRPGQIPDNMKRRIIFYVDNLSLAPFNRNRVFDQMKDFITTTMRAGDEAMVATYNRSMKVRLPFTRDPAQVISVLESLKGESGLGIANRSERRQVEERIQEAQTYQEAISHARSYAASVEHDLRQSVSSINALMATLAGLEGKKIMVMTSEGFPIQPGREAFVHVDEVGREKGWSTVGGTIIESMTYDGHRLVQEVAKTANANGITLYTVHAAGLTGGMEMSAEHSRPIASSVSQAAVSNTTDSMRLMADMTGGLASTQTNDFASAFNRIISDLDAYYSLGYRAGTERVDRQRYLEVKVKNKDYRVRHRQTFVEKSMYAEMSDRAVANLLYTVNENDLKIVARTGRPIPTEDGYFRIPVDIHIPMEQLTLLPQGEADYVGGFDVYVVVADERNDMSDVARKSHQIRVPAEDMKNITGKHYSYTLELLVEKGLNKISVGVVDTISNTTGFVRQQVIAKDMR
jgi:VWFA-related protein